MGRKKERSKQGQTNKQGKATQHTQSMYIVYSCMNTQVKVVVFDKTGTLTQGRPKVIQAILFVGKSVCPTRLFTAIVGVAESRSEHPLGVAIADFATQVL